MATAHPTTPRQIHDLIQKGQYADAERQLQLLQQSGAPQADTYYLQGVLWYFQGKVSQSIDALKRALSLEPKHTDAAICLSVLLNDIGKYDAAKKVFEQANHSVSVKAQQNDAGVDKKFAVKHLELADLYYRYRRYDEAIEEYTKAIQLAPQELEMRIRRAKAYSKKGFLTRALQELQTLKHEYPHFIPARIQLGLLQFSQGNVLDAELEWESILQSKPGNREAIAYLEMARKSRASGSSTPSAHHSSII